MRYFRIPLLRDKPSVSVEDHIGIPVPVHVIRERRRGARVSILKDRVNLRIPLSYGKQQRTRTTEDLLDWVRQRLEKHNVFSNKPSGPGDLTRKHRIMDAEINLEFKAGSRWNLKSADRHWSIEFPSGAEGEFAAFRKGAMKQIKGKVQDAMKLEFMEVERVFFEGTGKRSAGLAIGYTSSRWGSCNRHGMVRLSSRLAFAPAEIRRYVMVHELAHLIHFDHSADFWSLVERFIPDYKDCIRDLRHQGHTYDL